MYVRLGYEFNLACRAFNSIGVDTSDLGPVPDLLRTILEDTLSQPASPQALDNYLPRIRDIIINLLQGLKKKQSKLRTRPTKDVTGRSDQTPSRQMSTASTLTNEPPLDPGNSDLPTITRSDGRGGSPAGVELHDQPMDTSSQPQMAMDRTSLRRSIRRDPQKKIPSSDTSSSISSTTAQSIPVISPPIPPDNDALVANFPHAPPPAPKQDALTALQRGGDLERRASRRFSAYQIQKHLGASPNGVPVIPPAQNSPIPNRGREARESMRAVTSRSSYQANKQKPGSKLNDGSPTRTGTFRTPQTISEETEESLKLDTQSVPRIEQPAEGQPPDSPTARTPEEYHAQSGPQQDVISSPAPQLGATVSGPFSPSKDNLMFQDPESVQQRDQSRVSRSPVRSESPNKGVRDTPLAETRASATPPPVPALDPGSSPASVKDLTLFLQYKSKVKKFLLPGGYEELSIPRLQLAFIEKFAWHTNNNGVDLPEIYIQDPISGVRHELEDLQDVKDRSVLVLNFEVLDEVKKHFDEGIGGLKDTLEGVRSLIDGQSTMMQRFGDRQLEASKEMARLSAVPTPRPTRASTINLDNATPAASTPPSEAALAEVQSLRREIAVLRQTYSSMSSDFAASMQDIKTKAANVKAAAASAIQPIYEGSAGRVHLNEGKKTLQTDSEALVNRVDNLTDTVEDLRKDVVSRGVRPRPRDLEVLSKEIAGTTKALAQMKEFMKKEKPVWTKIWEQELNLVCTERDDLTQQEELMADLHGDLEDVQNVFNLVEEAMKQQNIQGGTGSLRQVSKTVDIDPTTDPTAAKEGVLDEVRALRPNHEDRLEAIERAEKARLRDLENRKANEFQREVANFVEEGKLKKTGGADEVERLREIKDKRAMQENWVTQQAQDAEKARKRAEREAAKAAAKAAADAEAKGQGQDGGEQQQQEVFATQNGNEIKDTSVEGEASFQDAPIGEIPQSALSREHDDQNGITDHDENEDKSIHISQERTDTQNQDQGQGQDHGGT